LRSIHSENDENPFNNEIESVKSPSFNTVPLSTRSSLLPWTPSNNRTSLIATGIFNNDSMMFGSTENLRPGEIVMKVLFADFIQQAEKKIEGVMLENSEKQITKG
jgi:hypothetical protein